MKKGKREKPSALRQLIGDFYYLPYQSVSYILRRWIFLMIKPKNLSIYVFPNISYAECTGLFDPDSVGRVCWGQVKVSPRLEFGERVVETVTRHVIKAEPVSQNTDNETSPEHM